MKRIFSLLIAVMLVLSMVPAVSFAENGVTVYIDPKNGSNDNSGTESSPVQNFTTAYSLLEETGGTIIMLSTVYYAGTYNFPVCRYPVTIQGKTGAEGIRTGSNIVVNGDTTFENMTFTHLKASTGTTIAGNGHKLTLGEGITVVPFENETDSYYFCLQGGHPSNAVESTDLTVRSGQWRNIYAGGYTKDVTGDARLTITGGTAAVVAPSYSASVGGNVQMDIAGAGVTTVYSGSWSKGDIAGNATVTLGQGATVKNLFAAGNGTGNVGSATVILEGYDSTLSVLKGTGNTSHTGTLGSSRLILKSGKLTKTPVGFGAVDIAVPAGKALTLAADVTADTLLSSGTLHFSGNAKLTAKAVSGSVRCTVEGTALKNQVYVTAPAGSAISFPEDTGITENNGLWVNHDLTDFAGLVLVSDSANKLNLYSGIWAQGTDTVYTVVEPYTTEILNGITYRYYPNAKGNYHIRSSRSGYIALYKNIHMTEAEASVKTTETITLEKKGANGFVPQTVYSHTTEVLSKPEAWKSEAAMFPKYENALDIPVLTQSRDPHQMTTQEELEADLAAQDQPDDNMYVFSLGKSGTYGYNIPLVIFTRHDLSGVKTLEEAAALLQDDRLTVLHRGQMHGNEPGGGEGTLAMIHHLQNGYAEQILDKVNLLIVPRLSPDGSYDYTRLLPTGVNPNRDETLLASAEMQAFQKAFLLFDGDVVLDSHERVWNNQGGDIAVSTAFTAMNSENYRQVALEMSDAAFRELEANGLYGNYYSNQADTTPDIAMGGGYYPFVGAMYAILESRGIYGGNEAIARRAVSHVAAVTGILDYLCANGQAVKNMLEAERSTVSQKGKTYDETDLFILQSATRTTNQADLDSWGILNNLGQTVDWGTGEVTFPVKWPKVQDQILRTRVAPTAYVIPAGEAWTEAVLSVMADHGIPCTYLPAGATLQLQRYGGTVDDAMLTAEGAYRFPAGCYVFTMNHRRALLLAAMMEPDNTNSAEFKSGLVQRGVIPGNSGIYRYIRDLNVDGSVDYTVTDTDAVTVTVYLDGTNGSDTRDGLTESTAVKTVEKAYAIMAAALGGADKGSAATLVVMGLYDLGAKQSNLPTADFPVVITGKTVNDGFSFTGGSSQATRTFEIHGDTTFQNIRLHINNTQSFNFLLANGHKLVIGEGVNTTTNKANCYFTIVGGDYDYTDVNASTDVTIRSGTWLTAYAGGYRGSVTGTARLDISGATFQNNIAATYCGNIGRVEMRISDTTVKNSSNYAIYMGPLDYSGTYKQGSVQGDSVLTLGENVSAAAVYGSPRTNGHIYGDTVVILEGADLSQLPVLAKYPETKGTTAGHKLILAADVTQDVTLDSAFTLDLNGYDITGNVTVDGTLTVQDSATDDYDVSDGQYGEITGTVTGTLVAKDGYIAAGGGFHKFGGQYISTVSLRPKNAGIYYTATFLADEILLSELETGVAVSLTDMPTADFETDADTLYTKGTTGVMIENILKGDSDDADRAIRDIYAASYVKLKDGTILTSDANIAYSLYDVLLLMRDQYPDAFAGFVKTHNIENWFI